MVGSLACELEEAVLHVMVKVLDLPGDVEQVTVLKIGQLLGHPFG